MPLKPFAAIPENMRQWRDWCRQAVTEFVSTADIANGAVTNAKLRNSVGVSVIGRSANSSGTPADIAAAGDAQFLSRHSSAVSFAAIVDADIPGSIARTSDFANGTYTPTLTNVANISASTAYQAQYLRVGSTVTVSGKVDIDAVLTATLTQLGISLPVASNFGAAEDCAGVAFSPAVASMGAAILADTANDRAQLEFISNDTANRAMYFTFSYQVI